MKLRLRHLVLLCAVSVALLNRGAVATDSVDDTSEEFDADDGDDLSHEDDSNIDKKMEEDRPDIICEKKDGMCKCGGCSTCRKKSAGEVNCEKVLRKNGTPLNTAFLTIREDTHPSFLAYYVNLKHNDIEQLRRDQVMPGREEEVEYLDVSFNSIEYVEPGTFNKFKRLAKLKLTHNRLRGIEIDQDWLTPKLGESLHQLHLDWNYIETLNKDIFKNLGSLTKLVLDGNRGIKLTKAKFGTSLTKLKSLSLDDCGLEDLDDGLFDGLPALQELSLNGNPLSTIPLAVKSIPSLSILAMSDTNFNEINKLMFKDFKSKKSLSAIYMRKMPLLYALDDCAFCRLENLTTVDLSYSKKLYSIDVNAFGYESDNEISISPKFLHMPNCSITKLDEKMLEWDQLTHLDISGNPLQCDCQLKWLIKNSRLHKFVGSDMPRCAGPEKLKGMTLKDAAESVDFGCETVTPPKEVENSGNKMTLALVLIGLVGCVFIVGVVYARRKNLGQALYFGNSNANGTWPSSTAPSGGPQLGYANLPRRGGNRPDSDDEGDDNRLEQDFHQPEFV